MECKQKPGQDLREHQLVFEAWCEAMEKSWGSMSCPLHDGLNDIQQGNESEAAKIKVMASNEIPLGVYYVQSEDRRWVSQLRVHLLVQPSKRLSAKATIEHNRWLLHEAVEEKLHTIDPNLLEDPVLLEIKEKLIVWIPMHGC